MVYFPQLGFHRSPKLSPSWQTAFGTRSTGQYSAALNNHDRLLDIVRDPRKAVKSAKVAASLSSGVDSEDDNRNTIPKTLIFCATKRMADELVDDLQNEGCAERLRQLVF